MLASVDLPGPRLNTNYSAHNKITILSALKKTPLPSLAVLHLEDNPVCEQRLSLHMVALPRLHTLSMDCFFYNVPVVQDIRFLAKIDAESPAYICKMILMRSC